VDTSFWRHLRLKLPKRGGGVMDVELLRPVAWLDEAGAKLGATIPLSLPEVGVEGSAEVIAIDACSPIARGSGRVVTGTFSHDAKHVLDVYVEELDEPIGVTPTHRIYSVDRGTFVPAEELKVGERVRCQSGIARVERKTARPGSHRVYNLEVQVDHVYHVTDGGLLVHNACPTWPATPEEMDDFLGFPGRRIPDGPGTPGRDKVVWEPNDQTRITFEQHPYHPKAPEWHRGPHYHMDTPAADHERFLPGQDMPGF
jgi:hypothetical protein